MSKQGARQGARPAAGSAAETGAALFANVGDFFRISGLGLRKKADATERVPQRGACPSVGDRQGPRSLVAANPKRHSMEGHALSWPQSDDAGTAGPKDGSDGARPDGRVRIRESVK